MGLAGRVHMLGDTQRVFVNRKMPDFVHMSKVINIANDFSQYFIREICPMGAGEAPEHWRVGGWQWVAYDNHFDAPYSRLGTGYIQIGYSKVDDDVTCSTFEEEYGDLPKWRENHNSRRWRRYNYCCKEIDKSLN